MDALASPHDEAVVRLLYEEAASLDERRWDDWLALFEPDAEYWIPAWDSEDEHTRDPQSEVSLMYYPDRTGLEDRVFRICTGKSAASTPLPRTCHMISNIRIDPADGGARRVRTHWTTHLFRNREVTGYFGRAEYLLARRPDGWGIRRKMTLVLNDRIDTVSTSTASERGSACWRFARSIPASADWRSPMYRPRRHPAPERCCCG